MTEHQKETAFLRRLIHLDGTDERRQLDRSIELVQRHQHCVRRALSLLGLFATLATLVFAYGVVLEENFPHGRFYPVVRIIGELGLASLISILALLIQLTIYRSRLNRLREECRCLVARLLRPHLENPDITSVPPHRESLEGVMERNGSPARFHVSPQDLRHAENTPPSGQSPVRE